MATLADLYAAQSPVSGPAPVSTARGITGGALPGTMTPEQKAYLVARQAGVDIGQAGPIGGSGQRLGTTDPYTAKATQVASTLGLGLPAGPTQQTASPPGSNTAASLGNASATYMAPKAGVNSPGAVPGAQQAVPGQPGSPAQNTGAMSPQEQAMLQQIMQQRARSQAQQMIDSRGVFAGQQQAVAPQPPPQMPPVPQRRGPPVGPIVPIPFGPR
jgi:hypothetical protein